MDSLIEQWVAQLGYKIVPKEIEKIVNDYRHLIADESVRHFKHLHLAHDAHAYNLRILRQGYLEAVGMD